MELSVKFENEKDLRNYFRNSLEEISEELKNDILNDISKIMMKIAPKEEKKIFKYIANRAIGHVNPPRVIEGEPSFEGITWKPLAKSTIKRKKHNRKWIDTGSLKTYLLGLSATYWYGNPKIIRSGDSVSYYSMFNYERKPFKAHDERGVPQEFKITGDGSFGEDGDNFNRPIFSPMEDFIFYHKVDKMIDEAINEYMEENYGIRFDVSST